MIKTYFILNAFFTWVLTQARKLKGIKKLPKMVVSVLFLSTSCFWFQSCAPNNDVQPECQYNTVTIKVHNNNSSGSQHLLILGQKGVVILNSDIRGNYTYSFTTSVTQLTVSAVLSSDVPFTASLEIDANDIMQAYHSGSCDGNSFDISKEVSF
jgi:hypothetical protein